MPVKSKTIAALDPCVKRVGVNSNMCTICKKWVHRRCSGLRGNLVKFTEIFQCSACTGCQDTQPRTEEDFGELDQVCKFTYLGLCIDASGDMEVTVTDRIQKAWLAFRKLRGTLLGKQGLTLHQLTYLRCVKPVLVNSCEAWALNASAKKRITSTERRIVRMMCGVSLADRVPTEQLFGRLNIDCHVLSVVETSQLRWFGHVMRRDTADPIRLALDLEVEGRDPKEDQRKLGYVKWRA